MSEREFVIPAGMAFSELRLTIGPDESIGFDTQAIERICEASDISLNVTEPTEEDVRSLVSLIVTWYSAHLEHGGAHDAAADRLIAEGLQDEAPPQAPH